VTITRVAAAEAHNPLMFWGVTVPRAKRLLVLSGAQEMECAPNGSSE